MGSWKAMAGAVLGAGAMGLLLVVGCSADGSSDVGDDGSDAAAAPDPTASLPPTSGTDEDGSLPPPPKDAGVKDATVDAGPPPPTPGTPCATPNQIAHRSCGACGHQETLCLAGADAGDAGGGTWTEYGPCSDEIAGGCLPGTTVTEACGNCGTLTKTCSKYCSFSTTACTGQPPSSCVPGAVDLSNAGCASPTVFRQRTCASTCTYDSFSTTCSAPPTTIEVGPSVGSVTSTIVELVSTKTVARLDDTCPSATVTKGTVTPYAYVQIHNPTAKTATVAVYNSVAPGGVVFPTVLASYAGASPPSTDALRSKCTHGVNNFGDDTLTGDPSFASLSDTDAVVLAPGATATIYNAAYDAYDAKNPNDSTGAVKLSVQTMDLK